MTESLAYLQKLPRPELIKIAEREGVELKPTWNRSQIAFHIRRQQLEKEKAAQPAAQPGPAEPGQAGDLGQRPANPEFEQALADQKPDGRGGPRPGAGRHEGVTNEDARFARLPKEPKKLVIKALKALFILWGQKVNLPEIELKDEEANELALPITQLLEYYFPDNISGLMELWAEAGCSLIIVVKARVDLINEARKRKTVVSKEVDVRQSGHSDMPGQVNFGKDSKSPKTD